MKQKNKVPPYIAFKKFLVVFALSVGCLGAEAGPLQAAELVEFKESRYNNIYIYRNGHFMSLMFGHNKRYYTETLFDTRDHLVLPARYTQYMTVGLAYAAKRRELLEIGFGGGRTAWYLHKSIPTLNITSVELDPDVVRLAKKYFEVEARPGFTIEVMDGRQYLRKNKRKWDVIMVDAYRGPFVPFHLLTEEFFQLLKKRLDKGGVAVQNIEPTTMVFDAAIRTMGQVFEHLDAFDAGGNVVIVAYDGPKKTAAALSDLGLKLSRKYDLRYNLKDMLKKRVPIRELPQVDALTDDFAPVESLLAIERHNRKLETTGQR